MKDLTGYHHSELFVVTGKDTYKAAERLVIVYIGETLLIKFRTQEAYVVSGAKAVWLFYEYMYIINKCYLEIM